MNMTQRTLTFFFTLLIAVILPYGCAQEIGGDVGSFSEMTYPTGMALHPNGRYLYVIQSNFNLDYRIKDGGILTVIDLQTRKILADKSKRIGSFGSQVVLNKEATRGYLLTRSDSQLRWFDISEDGSTITCPKQDESSTNLDKCTLLLDDEPTGMAIVRSHRNNPFDLLMIAHIRRGKVTAVTVQNDEDANPVFSKKTAVLQFGASDIEWLWSERFLLTGRSANSLLSIEPEINADGEVLGIRTIRTIKIPTAYGRYEGRGFAIHPNRDNVYLLNQQPNAIYRIQVAPLLRDAMAGESARVEAMQMLPRNVGRAIWVGDENNGYIYVSSVSEDQIVILDPEDLSILAKFDTDDAPYAMIYDATKQQLILENFRNASIWILDVSQPLKPVFVDKIENPTSSSE